MENILTIIIPLTALLVTILVAIVTLSFKVGQWKSKQDNMEVKIKESEERMDVKFDKIDRLLQVFMETKVKVDLIFAALNIDSMSKSDSPLTLSAKGQEARQHLKADEIVNKYKYKLLAKTNIENMDNPYDIQEAVFKSVEDNLYSLFDLSEMNILKTEAFKQGIRLEFLKTVFKIILRDEVLKEKNINVEDIDKHDPNKK
jgi:hypothetical protein